MGDPTTVLLAVLILDTVPLKFVTYTASPLGLTATPTGVVPTGTVATTELVVVLITVHGHRWW
jgi:hypothetical protein